MLLTRTTPFALLLTAAGLSGCAVEENERVQLGVSVTLDEFSREAPAPVSATSSVEGLDRSHWERTTVLVPVHGVAHTPTYAPGTFNLHNDPRQRGEHPTALTSLDLGEQDAGVQFQQMLRSQGQAALDAVIMPFRMVCEPLSTTKWSPSWSYERAPADTVAPVPTACCEGPCTCAPADGEEPEAPPADGAEE